MAPVKKNVHCCFTETNTVQKFLLTISVFALLLLGAHSLRLGDFGLATAFAIVAGLMFTQREWVRLVAVCALLWGGYIWADVTVQLVSFRQAFDMPWKRLGLIMAGVIVFDGLALLALVSRPVQDFFGNKKHRESISRPFLFLSYSGLQWPGLTSLFLYCSRIDIFLVGDGWKSFCWLCTHSGLAV